MVRKIISMRSMFTDLVAFTVARFSRLLNSRCHLTHPDGSSWTPQEVGDFGERVACHWLRSQGEKVLYRNYRAPQGGEVDIVARRGKLLLFIEVKTRRAGGIGRPLDAVNRRKQELIERGANSWLKLLHTRRLPWRFDVIEVILEEGAPPRIHRVANAF
ncbi:MAG: YraN family protein [Verrucomicrobia bacterium]|nr:MAG: YraN family protein [Verrucomicrobiota bacterium]